MMTLLRHRTTPIWLLLSAATGLSWLLGHHASPAGSVAVLLIAAIKIRFVLMHFMELRRAPSAWRLVFEAWLATVMLALLVILVRTAAI